MKIRDSYNKIFGDKNRLLVVLAHPDDNEIICGGIIARLVVDGKKVRAVTVTNGGKGFQDRTDITEEEFSKLRKAEQVAAGKALGIEEEEIINLDVQDGEFENNLSNIEKIVFQIRQFRPDIIITHNPFDPINSFNADVHWVNHRDHRNTALTTIDAVYPYSRDRGFFPEHFTKYNLQPHIVTELLFSDSYSYPDVSYFEITNFMDKKRDALYKHKNALTPEAIEEEFLNETKLEPGKNYERLKYIKI